MRKWWIFTKERFEPVSHLCMISLFFAAHYVVFVTSGLESPGWGLLELILLAIGTLAFFFKLRLYDEIKDYEVDLKVNPTRPLARGLVKHRDLYRGIVVCISTELIAFGFLGWASFVAITIAILYSLLMYKEFFIGELIRPHLTTYAVSHTVVSAFLSLALLSALQGELPWRMDGEAYFFALNSWCLFNIFEFGRKTFISTEERNGVESYSKIFGRFGAVILVIAMAIGSGFFLSQLVLFKNPVMSGFLKTSVGFLTLIGIAYVVMNRAPFGKIYRGFSSAYIVLVYLGLVAGYWIDQ